MPALRHRVGLLEKVEYRHLQPPNVDEDGRSPEGPRPSFPGYEAFAFSFSMRTTRAYEEPGSTPRSVQ